MTDYSAVGSHEGTVWEGFFTRFSPHRQPCPGSYSGWPGFVRVQEKCGCKYAKSCDAQSVLELQKMCYVYNSSVCSQQNIAKLCTVYNYDTMSIMIL